MRDYCCNLRNCGKGRRRTEVATAGHGALLKSAENIDAAAEAARGLVTSCESDAQGGEELGAEINLISASDSLPLENPPLLRQSLER